MLAPTPAYTGAVVPFPEAPHSIEETGLSFDLIEQLVLKTLHFAGELTGAELGRKLGLQYSAIAPVLEHVKHQYLVEVLGSGLVAGPAYVYRITDLGRQRALLFLEQSHYVGAAPVPFAAYESYMRAFTAVLPRPATRDRVRDAFGELVLSQRVLDQLGPAVNGGHSLFIYGAPGNGKTVISQAIRNLLDGEMAVPQAIEANGHIIQVFDAVVHEALDGASIADDPLDTGHAPDHRWVRCRRPLITVGGELTLEALDLSYGSVSKFYQAPVQMTANGGVLVIDDFGRQRCAPAAILNRWITPLESRVDFLTLQTGQKLPMPFAVLVVFATNIKPTDLVDEAFLRRIQYKVFAESPTVADFKRIFERCCLQRGLEYDEALVNRLIAEQFAVKRVPLRGCHPRDLITQALAIAEYLGEPEHLTDPLLKLAFQTYFVDDASADGDPTA
ncbi:MAG: ATP-binding protein [Acidobacteria bacterium]|nr:ATP-binding protein [Acidobacteriota bacterium]